MITVLFICLLVMVAVGAYRLGCKKTAWDAYFKGREEAARAVDSAWSKAVKKEIPEEVRKRKLEIMAEYRESKLEQERAIKLEEFKRGKIQTDNIEEGRKLLIPDNLTEEEQMIVKEFYNL